MPYLGITFARRGSIDSGFLYGSRGAIGPLTCPSGTLGVDPVTNSTKPPSFVCHNISLWQAAIRLDFHRCVKYFLLLLLLLTSLLLLCYVLSSQCCTIVYSQNQVSSLLSRALSYSRPTQCKNFDKHLITSFLYTLWFLDSRVIAWVVKVSFDCQIWTEIRISKSFLLQYCAIRRNLEKNGANCQKYEEWCSEAWE